MKKSQNQRNDAGITLVALIITIIILVILAAVSISAVYNSKIVDYAVNGATGYAGEAVKENEIMSGTESLLDSTVKKIEDILGGKAQAEPEGSGPQKGLTAEELKDKIGAYVNYQPDTPENATYSTKQDGVERSGAGEQTISKVENLKWRIIETSENRITLVSATATNNLTLQGTNGYNNGVKLLNDIANTLYNNNNLRAVGRSLNIDDINVLMGITEEIKKSINSNYGREYTTSNKYYPSIFADEKTGAPNGTYGMLLGPSDQNDWYSSITHANTLKTKWTSYGYQLSNYKEIDTVQHALATLQPGNSGSTKHTWYWLASRCVNVFSGNEFRIQSILYV